jgi:hypothetical protein
LLPLAAPVSARDAPRVVFLNPAGPIDRGAGPYWELVSDTMRRAARAFGIELEIIYAELDHLRMLRQAEEVAQRTDAPHYVVIVNEKLAAPQMLRMLARSPAKVLLIHNDLTAEARPHRGRDHL